MPASDASYSLLITNISRAWPAPTKFDGSEFSACDIFIAPGVARSTPLEKMKNIQREMP